MAKIAIMGFGTVGSGVLEVIRLNQKQIMKTLGEELEVKYILDIRDFSSHPDCRLFTKDVNVILDDPEITAVVEAMGGSHPAFDFSLEALRRRKSVITSNKEVVANFGAQLLREAKENGVKYLFEASVGGGIPIIRPLITSLCGNSVISVAGILNGTTNFILNEMLNGGRSFDEALRTAQENGYAERDPSADVDGLDTARKICILSAIAFGHIVNPKDVRTEGIRSITMRDITDADRAGFALRLLGVAERAEDGVYIMVCPFFVKKDCLLAGVSGVLNGVRVVGNAVGELHFTGAGAGKLPTASAMVCDVIEVVADKTGEAGCRAEWDADVPAGYLKDASGRRGRIYLRFDSAVGRAAEMFGAEVISDDALITSPFTDTELGALLEKTGLNVVSRIRVF